MTVTRRKRTAEEQAVCDEIETLKEQKAAMEHAIAAALDRLYAVEPPDQTDAVLGKHARDALDARRAANEISARIAKLTEHYQQLRARPAEDVPL